MKRDEEKSKIDTDDGWNRTFGGFVVVGLVVYILFINGYSTDRSVY